MIPRNNHQGEIGPAVAEQDWSELISRLAESLGRLVRAEIAFAETRVRQALSDATAGVALRVAAFAMLAATGGLGIICLLAAYIFLLHQWILWWEAIGAGGLTVIIIGLILFAILNAAARARAK